MDMTPSSVYILAMPNSALDILKDVFGYDTFRGRQAEIIAHVAGGGDCLVLMPTGGGKSLCYQLPALLRPGTGVVISPLIALMQDQVAAMRQLGVRAAFLNSTLPAADQRRIETLLRQRELDLLYLAPERLLQERTLALLEQSELALFAIDEAHCVSQWGHDFRPEYLRLDVLEQRFTAVPRLACTATADQRTQDEIVAKLGLTDGRVFVTGFDRPNIRYRVVPRTGGRAQLLRFIGREYPTAAGIVYCLSRRRVEQTADYLCEHGFRALPYHAGLPNSLRKQNQQRFLREDGLIIVATIAFGMGIDKPDVRFVAHLDLPRSLEAYYQETGRAGRDGLPATAYLTYGLQDVILLRRLLETSEADDRHKRIERQRLEAMLGYCEVASCRRRVLLGHFGEQLAEPCGNCDTCLTPPETFDGTVVAQKALSCVARTGQRFGALYVIDVLLGKQTARIERFGHDRISTFGIGSELDRTGWRSVLRQLMARGLLTVDREGIGSLQLTEASQPLLQGEATLELRRDPLHVTIGRTGRAGRTGSRRQDSADEPLVLKAVAGALDRPEVSERFARLRTLRRRLAAEAGVPPYVVFHDKTLAAMAIHRPVDKEQFLAISGVGQVKLTTYGDQFLAELNAEPPAAERPAD